MDFGNAIEKYSGIPLFTVALPISRSPGLTAPELNSILQVNAVQYSGIVHDRMGVQERKAREKLELRQEILDAARQLFVEQGYEAVSMRKIADLIEYSPTTIYLYFKDKADLFDCLCSDTFSGLIEQLESIPKEDPVQALRAGLRAYIDFGIQHPAHYRITFMTPLNGRCHDGSESRSIQGERAFGCLRNSVEACVTAGRFPVMDIELVSQAIWAAIHGVTCLVITHGDFPWLQREALIETLLDTVLGGLEQR